MKKQVWSMAALALLLTTASCTDEQMAGGASGSEAMVTFTAQLPQGLQTRAAGDGLTATTLSYAVYQHDTKTPLITSKDEVTFENGQATLSLRLAAGQSYDFLFWADAYGQDAADAPYTLDFNTQTLSVDYTGALSNEEARDAFFANVQALEVKGAVKQDVTLKRPFAQLNIGTDDMDEAQASGMATGSLKTSVKVAKIYQKLNLMDGQVSGNTEVTFEANNIPQETFTANGQTYSYLALNYLLVDTKKDLVNCEFTYTDGKLDNTMTIDNVPVQRNYRTNIFGSLLTGSVDFDITIDPDFEATDYNYAQLLLAAQNGGKVTLTDNVTLTEALNIKEGAAVTIDLNGRTITNSSTSVALNVYGSLVIDGEGTVDGGQGGNNVTVWAQPNSNVTINGGTFTVGADASNQGNSCIYSTGGTITINGGTFESKAAYNGQYYVLNLQNNSGGQIVCTGGTFKNYNPANGDDHDQPTNFVATGYSSVKISDKPLPNGTYRVVEGTGVANSDDIASAIKSGAELITLATDVTVGTMGAFNTEKEVTVDLNGQQLIMSNLFDGNISKGGQVTLRNGSVKSNGNIIISDGKLTLDNVTLDGSGYALNCQGKDAYLEIANSNLTGEYFVLSTNASVEEGVLTWGQDANIILRNSTFEATETAFMNNVPATVEIDGCTFKGNHQGGLLRGGTYTIKNSTFTLNAELEYDHGENHPNDNWADGNRAVFAGLTIGNRSATSYQYPTNVTLENVKVTVEGTNAALFPSVYVYANQGEGLGVTMNYDEQCELGTVIYGSNNITVNGKAAEITTQP